MKRLDVELPKIRAEIESDLRPAVLWHRAYEQAAIAERGPEIEIAIERPDGTCFHHRMRILPHREDTAALNEKAVERTLKFLLWMKGGSRIYLAGCNPLAGRLAAIYSASGARAFDNDLIGRRAFLEDLRVIAAAPADLPPPREPVVALGRHFDGCRIGFDLGGSDRKCAAVVDGHAVHTEEVPWDPYFQKDPNYHLEGVRDSLRRAAAHLPRVDAIGGSAAGIYIGNEPRVASLFRGVSREDFDRVIRPMFHTLRREWNHVPFEVANDGEVTALAGSIALNDTAVLGISLGTSVAAGWCDEGGHITTWLNELAFVPIDYRDDAPADEWSGDVGCSVQYLSQQGVARLAARAGIQWPQPDLSAAQKLAFVQERLAAGDGRAARVFEAVGVAFGYALARFADFYPVRNVLVLGRVTSGAAGSIILEQAQRVLSAEAPALAERLRLTTPDETMKRHGQAVVAASLPALRPTHAPPRR
ncbi:MAG: ROK family protein [Kiritimatiellae bacterium]|nr:ROK family protein [Kiritimatiellia bacterium]